MTYNIIPGFAERQSVVSERNGHSQLIFWRVVLYFWVYLKAEFQNNLQHLQVIMSYIVYMYYILYFQVHTTIHLCCFLYFEFLVVFHCCCVISYFVFSSYFILLTVGEDSTGDGFESNEFQNDICVSYKIMFSQSLAFFIIFP